MILPVEDPDKFGKSNERPRDEMILLGNKRVFSQCNSTYTVNLNQLILYYIIYILAIILF